MFRWCFSVLVVIFLAVPGLGRGGEGCRIAPLMQVTHGDVELGALIDIDAFADLGSGRGVVVAVIDTGIDMNNPLFASALHVNVGEVSDGIDNDMNGYVDDVSGWDMAEGDTDVQDLHGHGTQVASVVLELAPEVSLLPIKVTRGVEEEFNAGDAARAIIYAVEAGADIINLSFTSGNFSIAIRDAVAFAARSGVVVVGAAGNSGLDVEFPATLDQVIAVGSSGYGGVPSWFSPSGDALDLLAPGEAIQVTGVDFAKAFVSGTSFSAPVVSGAAAVLLSMNPHLKADTIKNMLYSGAKDVLDAGFDDLSGHGVVNGKTLYAEAVPSIYPLDPLQKPFLLSLGVHLPSFDTEVQVFVALQRQDKLWWLTPGPGWEMKTDGIGPELARVNLASVSEEFVFFGDQGVFPSIETGGLESGKYLWGIFVSDMNGNRLGPVGVTEMMLLE